VTTSADWNLVEPALDELLAGSVSAGQIVGSYRLLSLLGRGGMGEVYKAERATEDFQQIVALKLMRIDVVTSIERFGAERRLLAELDHPGIARLLDGGVTADGRPYMVMEYVEGDDLLTHCTAKRAPLEERLRLLLQVCDAVAYAHKHLIVHRDLKPANIIVTADGRTKLLDFGIAKLLQEGEAGGTRTMLLSAA
jgi:serine/threonine protein kinase